MKRKSIYKQIALSLLLLVCAAGNNLAWGQEYPVTGDKYLKPYTYLDLSSLTNKKITVDKSAEEGRGIEKAFDNDDETYWKASSGTGATVTIDFGEEVTIQGMSIWRSGEPTERAKTIIISTKTEEDKYETKVTQEGIPQGTYGNDRYTFTFTEIRTRYLKLEFTTYGSVSAFNEIDFITPIKDPDKLTIQHKYAKWYNLRQGSNYEDDFDEKNKMFDTSADWRPGIAHTSIQATHTYIDTIYAHRGSTVQLTLPDYLKEDISIQSYQRWYSFRTGRTFATQYEDESEEKRIVDLLTPTVDNFYYRLANGYVGSPLSDWNTSIGGDICVMNFYIPKDEEEFKQMFPNADKTIDNNWYVVACDVSGYTDYTKEFGDGSANSKFTDDYYEPTLSHRIVFYIHAVEDVNSWYNKAWKDNDSYLEEYEINMPFTRLPDQANGKPIYEMVALSKDARSYVDPDGNEEASLTISVPEGTNTAGIELITNSLSGTNRVISFDYPNQNENGTKSVETPSDGSTPMAEIIVKNKNGNKNIARFVLKFTKGTSLMTQSMIDQINKKTEEIANNEWNIYTERTPQYMEENYEFLTGLDFNFKGPEARQKVYYPYPLAWDHCSYAFFDGSTGDYFEGGTFPQWGYYSIMNNYLECAESNDTWGWTGHQKAPKPDKTKCMEPRNAEEKDIYHMFIDASDRPGIIARLPFEKELCAGSELFVSAWVKSAKWNYQTTNAAMLFTFMGVTKDGKYVPLYRHQTGQIPATYMDTNIRNLPGFGASNNEWFQLAFSFVTDQDIATEYRSFVLQIENNSASTSGGDMYLDDVRVYLKNVEAEVKQLESTCSDARTRLNFSIDWEQLLSRTGEPDLDNEKTSDIFPDDGKGKYSAIGICFIDRRKYESLIQGGTEKIEAIKEAHVNIGSNKPNEDGTEPNYYDYAAMFYRLSHEGNTDYDDKAADGIDFGEGALAMNNEWFFYKKEIGGRRILTVDFYAELQPYTPYTMIVVPLDPGNSSETPDISTIRKNLTAKTFADVIDTQCAIQTDVSVTSQSLITVDGEILDPGDEYCEGQIRNFAVQLQAPTGKDGALEPVEETVYFDWFFGSGNEFITDDTEFGVSLAEALQGLRNLENGTDIETKKEVEAVQPTDVFTESMKQLILREMEITKEGQNARLVLHKKNLNIQLLGSLNLVVRPIQIELTTVEEEQVNICWEYIPLELKTTGKSPVAHVGFHDVTYPAEPNIRIGLAQIEGAKDKYTLKINLRGVDLIEDNGELSLNKENAYVYLVGSNDPGIDLDGYTDLDLPIGTLHEIEATETGEAGNYIRISFDLEGKQTTKENNSFRFDPKEGYEYQLKIYFQEQVDNKQVTSLCDGNLVFTMKVVPEYQFWIGGATGNWNNDNNWVRAKAEDMNYQTGYTNYTSKHKGYVPMRFTNVVIPTEYNQVELYNYTRNTGTDHTVNISDNRPVTTEESTQYIEYDLMVKSATESSSGYAYDCEPYYSNTVDQIHFEPNSEMLHAEYLQYDTAWVEYELEKDKWHTLASPLQAVVSGDWYTATSGRQETEYFKDITFASDYSRLDPKVYQRGWGRDANMVKISTEDDKVAVSGNWSGVYNNVNESFTPGSGFSVKVIDGKTSGTSTADNDKALFRFPKSDKKYEYVTKAGDGELNRENAGKLQSNKLTETQTSFTAELHPANGTSAYYLVGNPFMTALNMKAFFDVNTALVKKYWHVTDEKQDIVAANNNTWVSTEGENDLTIPPLQSFFVQKAETTATATADSKLEITFTAGMQTLSSETTGEATTSNAMLLTATTADGRQSRAAIAYDGSASAGYEADEDAELFLDSNLSDVPAVYTVAGTMATSINRTSELWNIPVGVYGDDDETVTLSFSGLNNFSGAMFYDAEKKIETPLYEGKEIAVSANTSGRYFIRATAMPTANEPVIAHKSILIYSLGNGKALVTSEGNPLSTVRVYNMNGALIRQEKCSGNRHELHLPKGVYLIVASDSEGLQENGKVLLR